MAWALKYGRRIDIESIKRLKKDLWISAYDDEQIKEGLVKIVRVKVVEVKS